MEDSKETWSFKSRLAVAFVLVTVVLAAHLRVEAAGPAYQGVLLPQDRIFDVGCAVALVVLAWAIGRSILLRVGFSAESAIEGLLFATAIGIGIQGTSVLALGAASLLEPWALAVLGLLFVWGARNSLGGLREDLRRIADEMQEGFGGWILVALGIVAAFLLVQSATPPTDWDVLTYHLDVPREFLNRGEVFLPEDNHHAAFVGLVHMLYVPLLAVGAESAAAVFSGVVALLLALTMYAAGRRLFDEETGRLASVLVWGSPVILLVAVTARVDVTMTWFLVLAHYAVVVCLEPRENRGWWWMAAVLIGLAVATKYSALAYLAGLAPVIAWALVRGRGWSIGLIRGLAGFGAVVFLVATPWLVKNTLLFGAPLYPYLTELRLEPWLADYMGALAVPASIDPDVFRIPALTREPFSITALFTDPGSMTPEREGAFYFANYALLALPLAVLSPWRKITALLVPPAIYGVTVLSADSWINLRYLMPTLVMGTLVASHVLSCLGRRMFSTAPLRRTFLGAVVGLSLLPAGAAMYHKTSEMRPQEHWLGLRSESQYLRDNDDPDVFLHARAEAWINENLPDDARMVMLYESRGFRLRSDVLQDNLSRTWSILAEGRPWRDCLVPTGATHVLVNYGHLGSLVGRGLDIGTVSWNDFSRFRRACLQRQEVLASVVLYRIVR